MNQNEQHFTPRRITDHALADTAVNIPITYCHYCWRCAVGQTFTVKDNRLASHTHAVSDSASLIRSVYKPARPVN